MPWSCLQCSATNPDGQQECSSCGAKLPFQPPSSDDQQVKETGFAIPRRGELTSALRHGLESLRAGSLEPRAFLDRLQKATHNVPQVFAQVIDEVSGAAQELPEYGEEVVQALNDCQALFLSGLNEMMLYGKDQDDAHLRFGWLLVEKGEEEYVRILETLQRDAASDSVPRVDDLVGRLLEAHRSGQVSREDFLADLERFQEHVATTLEKAEDAIEEGLEIARDGDPQAQETLEEASLHLAEAAEKLGGLVLNLYHPAD